MAPSPPRPKTSRSIRVFLIFDSTCPTLVYSELQTTWQRHWTFRYVFSHFQVIAWLAQLVESEVIIMSAILGGQGDDASFWPWLNG